MQINTEFLVVYDYGTGGVWGLALARDRLEIEQQLPQLRVVETRPAWMDDVQLENIAATSRFSVGDPNTYPEWLRTLVDQGRR
jgi:hypothetical protein